MQKLNGKLYINVMKKGQLIRTGERRPKGTIG